MQYNYYSNGRLELKEEEEIPFEEKTAQRLLFATSDTRITWLYF